MEVFNINNVELGICFSVYGLLACFFTRFNATLILGFGFVVSFFAAVIFASGLISDISFLLFILSILILAVGVYGLRAVYFSVMEKGNIPLKYTGTAVGM
ncbi:MAG: hypothetical protein MUQ75_06260, partial [Crocinitomicaceae bacterium]|nr:hypothetical protein [Crocinitomicaceae bacterium]